MKGVQSVLVAIAILLSFQLIGEIFAFFLGLPVPGPVIGIVLLAMVLTFQPALGERIDATARGFLSHLSLLFVPAGVGVVASLDLLASNWLKIGFVLIVSTLIAMLLSVGTFLIFLRFTGKNDNV
jgi:putative effector of murein hydrolase LrgA (UPF0299 family)